MMHGHEKSDSVIVAAKPANKVVRPAVEQSAMEPAAAELVEPRTETKGNAGWQSTHRTQCRVRVSQALDRIRQVTAVLTRGRRSYGAGRRRLWHLHRPYELMEAAPWCKSTISAEA
jgi:RNA-directed DNA polymerase